MPSTPVYGIVFPCEGDPITVATFATFATTVEAALATVEAVETQALFPPSASVRISQAGIAAATPTDCVYVEEYWDNAAIATVATAILTVPVTGMYLVAATVGVSGFATISSLKTAVTVNAVEQLAMKYVPTGGTPVGAIPQGLLRLAAADQVRCRVTWTGTGGPATASGIFTLTLHSRLS